MSKASRFGFLLGLLAGTATVGTIGIMTGQGNANRKSDTRPGGMVATQSADGRIIYLWSVDPKSGELTLFRETAIHDGRPVPPQD